LTKWPSGRTVSAGNHREATVSKEKQQQQAEKAEIKQQELSDADLDKITGGVANPNGSDGEGSSSPAWLRNLASSGDNEWDWH
jgi:hypothetical protein